MKNYLKMNRNLDERYLRTIEKNLKYFQSIGCYPAKFDYPITLQFELTGQCNLKCKHCYNRSGDSDRKTLMTPEKWIDLANQIVTDGGIFQCIISGGEPLLLGDKLFEIMDILHDDGTSFVVITNGLLLDREKVKNFSKYRFFWFQISIDGLTPEIHDEFRGVSGSWAKAINGALEISDAGIPLAIAHSVTAKNLDQVEEMAELAYQLGANSIILGEILPSGRAIQNQDIILDSEQKNLLYSKIAELQEKYSGRMMVKRSAEVQIQLERYTIEVNSGGIIRPNGDFRLDCMAPFTIGNVLEKSIKEIWLEKGADAWHNESVRKFIESIDVETQAGNIQNHLDQDIAL